MIGSFKKFLVVRDYYRSRLQYLCIWLDLVSKLTRSIMCMAKMNYERDEVPHEEHDGLDDEDIII